MTRGATGATLAAALLACAGCSWRLPPLPVVDAGFDAPPTNDVALDAVDARDAADVVDAGDAADAPSDVLVDAAPRCPGPADMTAVRVAHLAPDLSAVDVCLKRASDPSGAFTGPVLAHDVFLPAGVAYQQLTGYFGLLPDTYTVRLVQLGAADCSAAVPGTVDATITVPVQTYSTLAIMGLAAGMPHATVRIYGDTHESTGSSTESPRLRVLHAAPDIGQAAVLVHVGGIDMEAGRAAFGEIGVPPSSGFISADCNGFFPIPAMTTIPVRIVAPPGASSALVAFDLELPFREVGSTFLTGTIGSSSPHPPQVLFCDDRLTDGGYAPCQTFP